MIFSFHKQKGQVAILLPVLILIAGLFLFSFSNKENKDSSSVPRSSVPLIGEDPPNEKILQLPAIKNSEGNPGVEGGPDTTVLKNYKLIRIKVPIDPLDSYYTTQDHRDTLLLPRDGPGVKQTDHFLYYGNYTNSEGVVFEIYYPNKWGESTLDKQYNFKYELTTEFRFHQEGILFFLRLGPGGQSEVTTGIDRRTGQRKDFWLVDIYQEESRYLASRNGSRGYTYDDIFKYQNGEALPQTAEYPSISPGGSGDTKQLQVRNFVIKTSVSNAYGFSAHCKPAIYLYPETTTDVNVQVKTRGELLYTRPLYPLGGWDVTAYPDGRIVYKGNHYDYLYYESRIPDSLINKPKDGFAVEFKDLQKLYDEILPKLGLDPKQVFDFKEYWQRTLPKSPYYFVGIMDEKNVDNFDPLVIAPRPVTIIRARLYFEALDKKIEVKAPEIITPNKNGFTVVEWGAMVKRDKNHPFTCSE